jgi:hypothetical protein
VLILLAGLLAMVAAGAGYMVWAWYAHEKLKERARLRSAEALEGLLQKTAMRWDAETRAAVEHGVELLRENRLPKYPLPLAAELFRHRETGEWMLSFMYLDPRADIEGLRIREVNDAAGALLQEDYPCYHDLSEAGRQSGFFQWPLQTTTFRVSIRTQPDQRKNESAWQEWVQAAQPGDPPPVYVGLPGPSRKVELALYDRHANISPWVPVKVHPTAKNLGDPAHAP